MMTCQRCGAQWSESDDDVRYYFRSAELRSWTSSQAIYQNGEEIENCPKCPIPRIDEAMKTGDDRTGGF